MISFLYLSKKYIKNFLLIAFALVFTITLITLASNQIDGFNRKILYSFYIFEDFLQIFYPMALVLGALLTFYQLIVNNHLLAFSSLSYKKSNLIKPFLYISFAVYFIFLALDFTPFAYAYSNANTILKGKEENRVKNMFFKYNDSFVYAKSLDVVNREFKDVKIYKIKDLKLQKILDFDSAKFVKDRWIAKNVKVKTFKYNNQKPIGVEVDSRDKIEVLKGYYPRVIKLLYEGKRVDLANGIKAIALLKEQHIDSSQVRSTLYSKLLIPLIAPFLILIFFSFAPLHKRVASLGGYLFWTMGGTIVGFIVIYTLNVFSKSSAINPNYVLPVVIFVTFIYSVYLWFKKIDTWCEVKIILILLHYNTINR